MMLIKDLTIGKIFNPEGNTILKRENHIMPQPIVPIHRQENMPIMFGESDLPAFQLSEIQSMMLQSTASSRDNKKYSANTISALIDIDKNTDLIVTALSESNDRFCSVPSKIDENTLIALKADGLISGRGRSVQITERGRTALRDSYLNTANTLKDNRVSEQFDFRSFSRIASDKGE